MYRYVRYMYLECNTCTCTFLTCCSELLDGLKAHKKKVSKLMARQKNMKFTETDIGKVK